MLMLRTVIYVNTLKQVTLHTNVDKKSFQEINVPSQQKPSDVNTHRVNVINNNSATHSGVWDSFIAQIDSMDPLLSSIFKQGSYGGFDDSTGVLTILFSKDFVFFNEMLENSSTVWKPLLSSLIGKPITVNALFNQTESKKDISAVHNGPKEMARPSYNEKNATAVKAVVSKVEKKIILNKI